METTNFKVAEIEIIYKTKVKASQRASISSSNDVYLLVSSLYNEDTIELREEFKMILLNNANKVLGSVNIIIGSITGTVVDSKLILATACKAMASGVILCHNHPSGNKKPSEQDRTMTSKIKEALLLVDISLLDHVIILPNSEGYYSFVDEGIL